MVMSERPPAIVIQHDSTDIRLIGLHIEMGQLTYAYSVDDQLVGSVDVKHLEALAHKVQAEFYRRLLNNVKLFGGVDEYQQIPSHQAVR